MPSRTTTILGAAIALACGAVPAIAQTGPATRARWGASAGIMQFGGSATFDYKNSPTPFAGASGPYSGAVLETDNAGQGFIFTGGFRAPVSSGGRIGFGFDAEFGGGGGHPADRTVVGKSPSGASVTFSTERGGIIDMVTAGGGGHVSFNLAPRLNAMAGVKISALRIKPGFGSYAGPTSTPGVINYLATAEQKSPTFWRTAVAPWIGLEIFLWNHGSLDVSASFEPTKSEELAVTPWLLTFKRHSNWIAAGLRIF